MSIVPATNLPVLSHMWAAVQKRASGEFRPATNLPDSGRMVGKPKSAGMNRHVVGDERALQES